MKKTILVSLFLLSSVIAFGQAGSRIGIKGGVNATYLLDRNMGEKPESYVFSAGPHVGLTYGYNATYVNMGFTLGLFYKNYTQHYTSDAVPVGKTWTHKKSLSYFEIPVLLRFRPQGDKMSRTFSFGGPYFEIGPQIGLLMSANQQLVTGAQMDISNEFESFNLSGVLGFGFHQVGTRHVSLTHGLRITYGFLDITSSEGGKGQDLPGGAPYKPVNSVSAGYILTFAYKF